MNALVIDLKEGMRVSYSYHKKFWRDSREYKATGTVISVRLKEYPWAVTDPVFEIEIQNDLTGKIDRNIIEVDKIL